MNAASNISLSLFQATESIQPFSLARMKGVAARGKMLAAVCSLAVLGCSVVQAGTVAQGKAGKEVEMAAVDYQPIYLATFNTGVKTSDVYTEGSLSFVIPVWSTLGSDGFLGGGVVYLEPYTSLGESGELTTSLGLGWRYLFNDQPVAAMKAQPEGPVGFLSEGVYVGANVFVDNLRTQFDNDFWQLGIGVEVGSRYVELRGNYYLPFDSSPKLAERNTSTQKFTSRRTQSSTGLESTSAATSSEPFATGNTIQQDVNITNTYATTTRTTTTTTTVKTITSLFEEGMEGWDVEAALLIPGLDKYLDVSLLAGYYSFDNQPFGPQRGGSGNTEGFKAGIEVRPVPALVLTGMWYEDEGLTGSDWVAGIGLQIPLSKDWKEAFKPRRRHLIERLAEPVGRQNAAIKTARTVDVDRDVSTQSRTRTAVRRTVTQQQGRITIAEDIVFVNNGGDVGNGIAAGSATGDGTAENPHDTIQAGADTAGTNNTETQRVWTVYTQDQGTSYLDSVTISGSTRFTSSYLPIVSPLTGQAFGGNTDRPLVTGGFAADGTLFLANATTPTLVEVSGYQIQTGYAVNPGSSENIPGGVTHPGAFGVGVFIYNVDEVVVRHNVVQGTISGIGVANAGLPQKLSITDNTAENTLQYGIIVNAIGGVVDGEISRNFVSNNGVDGIFVYSAAGFTGDIRDNRASFNDSNGITVGVIGAFTGDITGNTTDENLINGLRVFAQSFTGDFSGNVVEYNNGVGLSFNLLDGFSGNFSDNLLQFNGSHGAIFNVEDFTGNFTGNSFFSNGQVVNASGLLMTVDGIFNGVAADNYALFNATFGFQTGTDAYGEDAITGPNFGNFNPSGTFGTAISFPLPIITELP